MYSLLSILLVVLIEAMAILYVVASLFGLRAIVKQTLESGTKSEPCLYTGPVAQWRGLGILLAGLGLGFAFGYMGYLLLLNLFN